MMLEERMAVAAGGRKPARAAARLMANTARKMLSDAEKILAGAGDHDAAIIARAAGEATTKLIEATYDGKR